MEKKESKVEGPKILDVSEPNEYKIGQEVELIVKAETDLGYKAIVNGKHWGVLYWNEVFKELFRNDTLKGYIKKIREDGKIDLTLYPTGISGREDLSNFIMKRLEDNDGFLSVTDKTPADEIYDLFGVSKKKFKIALGGLYKKRLISIDEEGIFIANRSDLAKKSKK